MASEATMVAGYELEIARARYSIEERRLQIRKGELRLVEMDVERQLLLETRETIQVAIKDLELKIQTLVDQRAAVSSAREEKE